MALFDSGMSAMQVLAAGSAADLCRPCADCGQYTGRFCDFCRAADRIPSERWCYNQMTPLCSRCDDRWGRCHFCRRLAWCRPAEWGEPCRTSTVDEDDEGDSSSGSVIWFDEPERVIASVNADQAPLTSVQQHGQQSAAVTNVHESPLAEIDDKK